MTKREDVVVMRLHITCSARAAGLVLAMLERARLDSAEPEDFLVRTSQVDPYWYTSAGQAELHGRTRCQAVC